MDRQTDRWMDRQMNGWMNIQTDGWIDRQTDEWMHGWTHPASRAFFISFFFNSYYTEKEALHKSALSFEVAVAPILGLVIPVYRGQTGFFSTCINYYEKLMVKSEPTASK